MQTQVSAAPSANSRLFFLLWGGGIFTKGNLYPALARKGQGRVLPVTPPAQNNPFSKEAYFGVARADPLQMYDLKFYFHGSATHFSFYSCGQITFLEG